jgi:hypothetical protein
MVSASGSSADRRRRIAAYLDNINARPALKRADEKNQAVMKEHDLKLPGQ